MQMTRLLAGAAAVAFGLGVNVPPASTPDGTSRSALLQFSTASAEQPVGQNRRVSRRTARRTTRRRTSINTLPAGCVRRNAYWYCGGIYYQPVVQGGRTVYVVVNL